MGENLMLKQKLSSYIEGAGEKEIKAYYVQLYSYACYRDVELWAFI
ncbi:MAG: hypothetical protein JTT13_10740 [Candidatus Brockarchaeota archaeon]|nr:hypothetical protein [Candidatus Brockarchaeota archaeon]